MIHGLTFNDIIGGDEIFHNDEPLRKCTTTSSAYSRTTPTVHTKLLQYKAYLLIHNDDTIAEQERARRRFDHP